MKKPRQREVAFHVQGHTLVSDMSSRADREGPSPVPSPQNAHGLEVVSKLAGHSKASGRSVGFLGF